VILSDEVLVTGVCMYAYCVLFFAIDSNDESAEEGEVSECQEEGDQGQAIKASHLLVAYLNPNKSLVLLLLSLLCILFLYCYFPYIAIVGDLAPQVDLLSSLKMTPLKPTQYPGK
jgi:hypothetical protein